MAHTDSAPTSLVPSGGMNRQSSAKKTYRPAKGGKNTKQEDGRRATMAVFLKSVKCKQKHPCDPPIKSLWPTLGGDPEFKKHWLRGL